MGVIFVIVWRKAVTGAVAAVMLLTALTAGPASAAAVGGGPEPVYEDESLWPAEAKEFIREAIRFKVMTGYDTGRKTKSGAPIRRFRPNDIITRAEYFVLLARVFGEDESPYCLEEMPDMPRNAWYCGGVLGAAHAGIIDSTQLYFYSSSSRLAPNEPVDMITAGQIFWNIVQRYGRWMPLPGQPGRFVKNIPGLPGMPYEETGKDLIDAVVPERPYNGEGSIGWAWYHAPDGKPVEVRRALTRADAAVIAVWLLKTNPSVNSPSFSEPESDVFPPAPKLDAEIKIDKPARWSFPEVHTTIPALLSLAPESCRAADKPAQLLWSNPTSAKVRCADVDVYFSRTGAVYLPGPNAQTWDDLKVWRDPVWAVTAVVPRQP